MKKQEACAATAAGMTSAWGSWTGTPGARPPTATRLLLKVRVRLEYFSSSGTPLPRSGPIRPGSPPLRLLTRKSDRDALAEWRQKTEAARTAPSAQLHDVAPAGPDSPEGSHGPDPPFPPSTDHRIKGAIDHWGDPYSSSKDDFPPP